MLIPSLSVKNICGLAPCEIIDAVDHLYPMSMRHALAVANGVYKKGVVDFLKIESIPRKLGRILNNEFQAGTFNPVLENFSADGSVKYLYRNPEGLEYETVYIPDTKRNTVCVSTQSGCRMGCQFCATARYGFHGDLTAGEIINQVISIPDSKKVNRIVFMGMGEPMDNLPVLLKAIEILTAGWGLAISPGNITVSTVGIRPGIIEFLKKTRCNLVLSLFSPFRGERQRAIPVEKVYPSGEIIEIMKSLPHNRKRRLSIAYVMIRNLNDTDSHLNRLKDLFSNSRVRINLLPYHPVTDDLNLPSSSEKMNYFKHELVISGISASIRKSRGTDIDAACGLLAGGHRTYDDKKQIRANGS
jgi:23S rRNA (adenine2503-C2)-methyltransferase